jgi:hypothetical protein
MVLLSTDCMLQLVMRYPSKVLLREVHTDYLILINFNGFLSSSTFFQVLDLSKLMMSPLALNNRSCHDISKVIHPCDLKLSRLTKYV